MYIFDSHCHLDDKVFKRDFTQVIRRAGEADVQRMVVVGIDRRTSQRAVALAEEHPQLFASVGIHPHDAQACSQETLDEMIALASHPRVVAWGETGLDFYRMYSPRKDQERCFVRQLEIADQADLPLIFHERDSSGRFLELLEATPTGNRRAVIHCFSGTAAELSRYLEMGFYIGITGIVTMKKRGQELRSMLPDIPQNRLMIETDAPYLTPSPQLNKHRRNEPAFVRQVLMKVAEVLEEDPQQLSEQIWNNTCTLFRINPATD